MRRYWLLMPGLLLVLGLLLVGCGRKRTAPPGKTKKPSPQQLQEQQRKQQQKQREGAAPPNNPTSVQVATPTVKVADPKGRWTMEAQADTMTATSQEGPYVMQHAAGVYTRAGEAPVHMRADQITVDKASRRVTLVGSVHFETPTMQLDAPRIEYDLDTQQVHATGPTKAEVAAGDRGSGIGNRERLTAGNREPKIENRQRPEAESDGRGW